MATTTRLLIAIIRPPPQPSIWIFKAKPVKILPNLYSGTNYSRGNVIIPHVVDVVGDVYVVAVVVVVVTVANISDGC